MFINWVHIIINIVKVGLELFAILISLYGISDNIASLINYWETNRKVSQNYIYNAGVWSAIFIAAFVLFLRFLLNI